MRLDLNKSYGCADDSDPFSLFGNSNAESDNAYCEIVHSESCVDESESEGSGFVKKDHDLPMDSGLKDEMRDNDCGWKEEKGDNDCGPKKEIGGNGDSVESMKALVEKRLALGSFIDNLNEVHLLYCEYARLVRFLAKKGTQSYILNSMDVRVKVFHCSCEGNPNNRRSKGRLPSYKKRQYQINCKARLRVVRLDDESTWKVSVFYKQHNHELVHPSESYLLRSAHNLSDSKKALLIAMQKSGIGVSRSFCFMSNEAGSVENVGFIRKDAYNELQRDSRMQSKVDNADVNKLLDHLTRKGLSDPSFYFKVKIGADGRLEHLLFRDGRCLTDYQYFGDVISIDATYKTNKYIICVPIIGINHHRKSVMFAVAFLSNEKTESYEWLFSSFLKSMYQKEPDVIFSDQDQALMNGIDYIFSEASHRICQWHVNKNFVKHFGKLNMNANFKKLWFRLQIG